MPISSRAGLCAVAATLLAAALLSACGGGNRAAPAQPSPATPAAATELTLSSTGTGVIAGGTAVTLTASLNGAGSVGWMLAAGSPGTLSATSGASVSYTPPASFTGVTAVTLTATSGNLSKNIVLSLAPTGPGLTLLAGTVSPGYAILDGRGAAARFAHISAVAADSKGSLYVADNGAYSGQRSLIRKVSADGTVSALPADWSALPAAARINAITAMTDGSVYFSDVVETPLSTMTSKASTTFRKLDASGKLTMLGRAEDGTATSWRLHAAPDGTLYVHDGSAIYLLAGDGSRQLLAGAGAGQTTGDADGAGSAARFQGIMQIRVAPDGKLYVLDTLGVRQVTQAGVVTTLLPLDVRSGARDLSLDPQGKPLLLYAPDSSSGCQIRTFSGGALSTLYTVDTPSLTNLLGMADGAVITTDTVSLMRTGSDGKTAVLAGVRGDGNDALADGPGPQARLVNPDMLAADRDGNIYAQEDKGLFRPPLFRKITPTGVVSSFIGSGLTGYVSGMAFAPDNTLVVSVRHMGMDEWGGGVYRLGADGSFRLIAGGGFYAAPAQQQDGQGSAAIFGRPTLAGIDQGGNIYVSDKTAAGATTIRKVTPQGAVTTASLPAGLNAAPDGNVYTVNSAGTAVVRTAPDGTRTVVAGVEDGSAPTNLPGALPGRLYQARSVVPLGGKVFAVAAGHGIYTLVLP